MSSKDSASSSAPPPTTSSPPAQIVPVDLATKAGAGTAAPVAQIRIPTVQTTNIKPTLISTARPAPGPSPGARPLTSVGTVAVTKPGAGASITMIQGGKVVVPGPSTPATRPILAQPGGGALVRGVAPALTLRAPAQPAAAAVAGLSGSIRLASPGSVHLLQPATTRPAATPTAVPRPGAVLGVAGPRATMAAVSFRPSTALVTTARPTLSPTGAATAVTLVQTPGSVTKTIVTQNPAGVFKPITTQVSVSGAPVALKPSPVSGAVPVRVQSAGQRTVTVVSQPLAVSLTSPAPGTGATHIQVPMVPGAVGPPKTRVAVPAGGAMKLVSGVSLAPVQITHTQSAGAGARTIQLPVSGPATKPGASVPVARVTPQQHGPGQVASLVTFVPASGSAASQAGPVNLSTVARPGAVVAPAMTLPNFSQTTLMYDRAEQQQSSVTITTLPPPAPGDAAAPAQPAPAPATITPARITPILPPSQPQDAADKPVPGSPRPSILRKRPDTEPAVTPVKGTALLTSPTSPPRPESSGSSTISATSSLPGLSGDEAQAQPPPAPASIEPSPRKKPRKQQLPPREAATNVSPEWATVKRELGVRDRLEWNTRPEADWEGKVRTWQETWPGTAAQEHDDLQDMVQDQADDEDEMSTDDERDKQLGSFIRGKPQVSLLNSYRHTWKSRHNHFLRYSDVKSKDERRPTVNELANQKLVLQKINGWKIYHLSAGMEDVVEMENDLSDRLEDFAQRLEDAANKDVEKELTKVQELIKANIQRSKVIQDQVSEAKDNSQTIFEHKPKIQDIILKYQSKRDRTVKGRRDN